MNELYLAEISEEIDTDIFNNIMLYVSKEKQKQIQQLHLDIDKKLCLYSDILARLIICKTLNISNDMITFKKTKYGKPYLYGYNNFNFNISHTRNTIAIAISERPVGVDIEKIRSTEIKIAKRFFTANEFDYISEKNMDAVQRFFLIWTKKEAYMKYVGKGLFMQINSFDVCDNDNLEHIWTIEKNGYIISVCSEYPKDTFDLIELSEKRIQNEILGRL